MEARTDDVAEPSLDNEGVGNAGLRSEVSEADAAEQHLAVRDDQPDWPRHLPFDVDPADAADQQRLVELDEDDYR